MAVATEPVSGGVDVGRLMEKIKERVRQRKVSGFYSEEEVRRIAEMELEVTDALPTFRSEIEHHLAALNDAWDTAAEPSITSHRKVVGPLIVGFKRLLRRVTRPYITLVLARQVSFNSTLLQLLNGFVIHVRDAMGELPRKAEDLSLTLHERLMAAHTEGRERHRELLGEIERLRGELAALRATVDRVRDAGATPVLPPAPPPAPKIPVGIGILPREAYLQFEDRHRGSPEEIRERQRGYLALFPRGPVLDVGCGRGEFLTLCRENGVEARGVDLDPAMVARCREAGLETVEADALAYLAGLPDGSLGGVFSAQLIEHLMPEAFIALVRLAHAKLRPGGVLLCETPNPMCLTIFASAFYVDLTHIKPIHPQGAAFVLEAAGFRDVELSFVNPCPPEAGLRPLEPQWYMRRYEVAFLWAINENLSRLNDLLWGAQDYAVIGRKP
jgi:O-antigen chain-terminating methyltransferase